MSTSGAQVVVFNEDASQVLLVKREDFRVWTIPGGRIETDETPEDAGYREVLEETGYSIRIERLVGEYWRPQLSKGGSLVFGFVGRAVSGDASRHDWESLAVEWFDVDCLPQPTIPFARELLEDARANFNTPVKRTQLLPFWQNVFVQIGLVVRNLRNYVLRR